MDAPSDDLPHFQFQPILNISTQSSAHLEHGQLLNAFHINLLQTESQQRVTPTVQMAEDDIFEDDDWEDQADKLYEWTQNLSLDELGVTSP